MNHPKDVSGWYPDLLGVNKLVGLLIENGADGDNCCIYAAELVEALGEQLGPPGSYSYRERRLRALVKYALTVGEPICACNAGYYYGTADDLIAYAERMEGQAHGLLEGAAVARRVSRQLREAQPVGVVTI